MIERADSSLSGFARFFLDKIPESKTLVSVHNNTNGAYSLLSYAKGGSLQKDAEMLHQNKQQDADDFFITTDAAIFNYLKEANYNVVLQHNTHATDDGSLSIFYGRKNKSYVNVEAEHGHLAEQKKMLACFSRNDGSSFVNVLAVIDEIILVVKPSAVIFAFLKVDFVAQLVEQYTFNVWALGSSPSGITETKRRKALFSCQNV